LVNDIASYKKSFIEALITVNGGQRINLDRTQFSRIVSGPYLQNIAQRSVIRSSILEKHGKDKYWRDDEAEVRKSFLSWIETINSLTDATSKKLTLESANLSVEGYILLSKDSQQKYFSDAYLIDRIFNFHDTDSSLRGGTLDLPKFKEITKQLLNHKAEIIRFVVFRHPSSFIYPSDDFPIYITPYFPAGRHMLSFIQKNIQPHISPSLMKYLRLNLFLKSDPITEGLAVMSLLQLLYTQKRKQLI
jgi:hypothetical protein